MRLAEGVVLEQAFERVNYPTASVPPRRDVHGLLAACLAVLAASLDVPSLRCIAKCAGETFAATSDIVTHMLSGEQFLTQAIGVA